MDGAIIAIAFNQAEWREIRKARELEGHRSASDVIRSRMGFDKQFKPTEYFMEEDLGELTSVAQMGKAMVKMAGEMQRMMDRVERLNKTMVKRGYVPPMPE